MTDELEALRQEVKALREEIERLRYSQPVTVQPWRVDPPPALPYQPVWQPSWWPAAIANQPNMCEVLS